MALASLPMDIYDAIGDHVEPRMAAMMRATNRHMKESIDYQWEESTSLIPDDDRIDPLEPGDIIAQVPRGDPIPFDIGGDIRHITAYMKSMYGESITLLTPDLFEKLEGKIVSMIYSYHGQNTQLRVVDNLFSFMFIGNKDTNFALQKFADGLIAKKKVAKARMNYKYMLKNSNLKNGYFTLRDVEYNYVDKTIDSDGTMECTWLPEKVTVMCPCASTIAFVFLKHSKKGLTKKAK